MTPLPCVGCKHLRYRYCGALDSFQMHTFPYTNKTIMRNFNPHGILGATVDEMRAAAGECGPDRKLYTPSMWTRIKEFFK